MNHGPTLENLIGPIATWIGMQPTTLLFYIGILVMLANFVSKAIPDNATGIQGWIRSAAGFLGLAFSNRIAPGVSQVDLARQVFAERGLIAADPTEPEPTELDQPMPEPSSVHPQMFVGVGRDPNTGKFTKVENPWWVSLFSFLMIVLAFGTLAGCVTQRTQAQTYACAHADQIRAADPIARLKS